MRGTLIPVATSLLVTSLGGNVPMPVSFQSGFQTSLISDIAGVNSLTYRALDKNDGEGEATDKEFPEVYEGPNIDCQFLYSDAAFRFEAFAGI